MDQIKNLAQDRRGSTLIEIIVSVLIIGIAFVPLMMGLNSSIRINEETEKQLYAENLASDLVEVCKTYGENGLSSSNLQGIFTGATASIIDGNWTLTGLESGDRKYSAVIEFDESPYTDAQNDYSAYPTLSKLDNICTVSITQPDDILDTILDHYWIEASTGSGSTDISEENFKKNYGVWLTRKTNVYVIKASDADKSVTDWTRFGGIEDGDVDKYVIMWEYEYGVNISAIDADGHKYFGTKTSISAYKPASTEHNKIVKGTKPSIILVFDPLNDVTSSKDGRRILTPTKIFKDEFVIAKKFDDDLYIYSLCRNGAKSRQTLTVDGTGSTGTGTVKFYSNINMIPIGAYIEKIDDFGSGGAIQQPTMKNVKVTVKTSDASSEILVKDATVVEFE